MCAKKRHQCTCIEHQDQWPRPSVFAALRSSKDFQRPTSSNCRPPQTRTCIEKPPFIVQSHGLEGERLGRGLINSQPQPDCCKLNEGEVIGREFVVGSRNATTLLDLVEEPLNQISGAIEVEQASDEVHRVGPHCFRPRARLATSPRLKMRSALQR